MSGAGPSSQPPTGLPTGAAAKVFDTLFGTRMATEGAQLQLPRKIPVRVEPKTFFGKSRVMGWFLS